VSVGLCFLMLPSMILLRMYVGDGYTVCSVYQMLMRQKMHNLDELLDAVT